MTQTFLLPQQGGGRRVRLHEAVARSGVAYDAIYADDRPCRPGPLPLRDIRQRLPYDPGAPEPLPRSDESTAVLWLYAQGYCDGQTLASANLAATVGMDIRKCADPDRIRSYTTCDRLPEATVRSRKATATRCSQLMTTAQKSSPATTRGGRRSAQRQRHLVCRSAHYHADPASPAPGSGAHRYVDIGDPILAAADWLRSTRRSRGKLR
jgi:hypothetical protein